MEKALFSYELPQQLIAQTPLKDRSSSRLMVLDRSSLQISHRSFWDIMDILAPGDCLVINNTKVIPARLLGVKENSGAKIEVLLLKRIDLDNWECIVYPGKRMKKGTKVEFGGGKLVGIVTDIYDNGNRIIRFEYNGVFEKILEELGQMPLPPYITESLLEKERYQTVYAAHEGSAAAPTAGLHFTEELIEKLEAKGVIIARLTLHVGLGTFRPVKEENILNHKMHSEYCEITSGEAHKINHAKENGGKIIAVGTTSVRSLEAFNDSGKVYAVKEETDIFIYPGFKFKVVDGIITNFHLPESTLLMLISAFAEREFVLAAYKQAVSEEYRFFSFGDAMFLL